VAEAVLSEATLARLGTQLEVLPLILAGASPAGLAFRPPSGKWSAHQNLAHLARHHELFLQRLNRVLEEDRPLLGRYQAEEDPDWPRWSALGTDEVLARLRQFRAEIIGRLRQLSPAQLGRVGLHPLFGELTIPRFVEFFLLHEAHHLYLVMIRMGEGAKALAGRP
jgi:hypothetical protein